MGDCHGDAAFRGAIELGQDDAGHAGDARELARLREAVLPHGGIEHEQHLVGSAFGGAARHAANLVQFAHQVGARVQPAGGVDENRVAAARPARLNRVEHDRRRIRSLFRADDIHVRALGPDRELLDRGRAERVSGAHKGLLTRSFEEIRQLADGRRLAGAVDADNQRHLRMVPVRRGRLVHCVEDAPDLVLDEIAQAFAAVRARADGGDNLFGGGDADVGGNQQLLERFDRIDVDFPGARLLGVGTLNDFVEPADNLLFGTAQALAQPIKKPHCLIIPPLRAAAAASSRTTRFVRPSGRPEARPPGR